MSTVFILMTLLGGVFILIAAAGLFLPTSWRLEKAELVHAKPTDIFPLINNLKNWEDWTVWDSRDEDLSFEYEGNAAGKGAVQVWSSRRMNGKLSVTASFEPDSMSYVFDIKEGGLTVKGTLALAVADVEFTQVAWRCELDVLRDKNPIRRYQALFIKNYFEKAIEDSLLSLQSMFDSKVSE